MTEPDVARLRELCERRATYGVTCGEPVASDREEMLDALPWALERIAALEVALTMVSAARGRPYDLRAPHYRIPCGVVDALAEVVGDE